MNSWWALARPRFLLGGVVMVVLGAALAGRDAWDVPTLLAVQAFVTITQITVHFHNDLHDVATDQATDQAGSRLPWSGGSGVLSSGLVDLGSVRRLVGVLWLTALAVAVFLTLASRAVLPWALGILVLSWAYSAPPVRLCARGLGEITTAAILSLLIPGLVLRSLGAPMDALVVAAPVFVLFAATMLALERPDVVADRATNKRTLVARLGAHRARRLEAALLVMAGALALGLVRDHAAVLVGWAAVLPLAGLWAVRILRDDPTRGATALATTMSAALVAALAYLWFGHNP